MGKCQSIGIFFQVYCQEIKIRPEIEIFEVTVVVYLIVLLQLFSSEDLRSEFFFIHYTSIYYKRINFKKS